MSWPLSQDYNEAIQNPASNFADPDLRRGEAVCNALGIPMPYSGNFADVYQVRCPDGSRWAVKCFTREVPGLRERYQEISKHLCHMKLPFTVDFTYLELGIRVAETWYPALKMQWVEGLTLNQFVSQHADNRALLQALLQNWGRMAKYLRAAQVGHCDLQHGNVLLTPGATSNSVALKLIDYDGMWVPALAGKRSGEVGHANYQHPERLRELSYNIDVDRFPGLLIATALRALQVKGRALWEKYDNGDNLLFREADLLAPLKSHLFLDLTKTGDPLVSRMMDILVKSLRGSLETVPLLEEVMPEAGPTPTPNPPARPAPTPAPIASPGPALPMPPVKPAASRREPWTFRKSTPTASNPAPSRPTAAKIKGAPVWAWAAAFTLLLVGLAVAGGMVLFALSGDANQRGQEKRVAQSAPEQKAAPAHWTWPPTDNNSPPSDKDAIPVEPPMPNPPDPPAPAEPGKDTKPPAQDANPPPRDKDATPVTPMPNPPDLSPLVESGKYITNSIGMKLVRIEPGRFQMGSPKDEEGRFDEEGPQHEVEITRPFYMGAYPVTKGQFGAFVKDAGYQTEAEKDGKGGRSYNATTRRLVQDPKYNWKDLGFTQTDDHPAVNVTWNDATAFCTWLSKKEGKTYDLPTEAEWEYACRAGTKTRFWCGDADASLKGNANVPDVSLKGKLDAEYAKSYTFVSWDDSYPFTSPVGKFNPNPWGLYDMSGNVWQWCADRKGKYQDGFIKDPKGDESEEHRVMRGGTWLDELRYCRSANRYFEPPAARFDNLGFRVVSRAAQGTNNPGPVTEAKKPEPGPEPKKPEPDLTRAQFDKIAKGMTKDDLVALLGPTSNEEASVDPRGVKVTSLEWSVGGKTVKVTLHDGKTAYKASDQGWPTVWPGEEKAAPADKKPVATTTPSGLKYLDSQVGDGKRVKAGDTVTVNYVAMLKDGTKFDSSADRNMPFTFQVGKPRGVLGGGGGPATILKCWDEAVTGMKRGGKRELTVPPGFGFGATSVTIDGVNLTNQELHLEVELVEVK